MHRRIREHLDTPQVSRVIYGSIIGLALILVLEHHPPAAGVAVGTILATALAVALAEFYSEVVGAQVHTHRRVDRREAVKALDEALPVAFGVSFPAVFFVLAAFDVMTVETAIDVSKWSGLGLIGFYGFAGARLAGRGTWAALAEGALVGVIGGILIAIKALVH